MYANALRIFMFAGALLGGTLVAQNATACPALQATITQQVSRYLAVRYSLPVGTPLQLKTDALLPGSCIRSLTYAAAWPAISITVLLSPDGRYAFPGAFDLQQPPRRGGAPPPGFGLVPAVAPALAQLPPAAVAEIEAGAPASQGPAHATVTVVEFSDFECPFCKRLTEAFQSQSLLRRSGARLVFREFPLPVHAWAEPAAEAAECARQQDGGAFWRLHDYFFAHQTSLDQETMQGSVDAALRGEHGINLEKLHSCMATHATAGRVQADIALGRKFGVHATPTFFVNGRRVAGAMDPARLQEIIDGAKGGTP